VQREFLKGLRICLARHYKSLCRDVTPSTTWADSENLENEKKGIEIAQRASHPHPDGLNRMKNKFHSKDGWSTFFEDTRKAGGHGPLPPQQSLELKLGDILLQHVSCIANSQS